MGPSGPVGFPLYFTSRPPAFPILIRAFSSAANVLLSPGCSVPPNTLFPSAVTEHHVTSMAVISSTILPSTCGAGMLFSVRCVVVAAGASTAVLAGATVAGTSARAGGCFAAAATCALVVAAACCACRHQIYSPVDPISAKSRKTPYTEADADAGLGPVIFSSIGGSDNFRGKCRSGSACEIAPCSFASSSSMSLIRSESCAARAAAYCRTKLL